QHEIELRFAQTLYGLRGARATYAASREIRRGEFRAYVASRDMAREFPGVRGFGFIQHTDKADDSAVVAAERADEAPGFAIRELGPSAHEDRYLVIHIEPLARNGPEVGMDVGSEGIRRQAIERSISTGEAVLTPPLVLDPDDVRSAGFLLYQPVYRRGSSPQTAEARRDALLGVLFAPIVAAELLDSVAADFGDRLSFDLHDGTGQAAPVFAAEGRDASTSTDSTAATPASAFERSTTMKIAGLPLRLRTRSSPAFESAWQRDTTGLTLAGGLLLTALLATLAFFNSAGRQRAEALAARMTRDLDRLAMVARRTSDAVAMLDPSGCITWVNASFERLTGFTAEEAVGQLPGALLDTRTEHPADAAELQRALAHGGVFHGELCQRRRDGSDYWVELELQPLRDSGGALTGFMSVESDISARRQAEGALAAAVRDNEAMLSTLHAHTIVSVTDADGRIVDVNPAFCEATGYDRDELIGSTHALVNAGVHPAAFWQQMWSRIATGQPWRGPVCNRAKDGTLRWMDSIVAPFTGADGRIERYISIRTDITATRRAADDLARERERLALIIEGTDAGTWEVNLETGQDVINPTYAAMLGDTVASLRDRMPGSFLDLVHEDDHAAQAQSQQAHFDDPTLPYAAEFRMRHRDGRWLWILSRGRVGTRDIDGRPLRMAGIHLDITERKLAEQTLRESQSFLDTAGRIAGIGGWMLELSTQEMTWSDQTCRLHEMPLGHRPTLEEALSFYPPEHRDRVNDAALRCIDTGEPFDDEVPLCGARGDKRWVRLIGHLESVGGRPLRLVGAIQDVTARRAMADELRRTGEVMANIVENLPCGVSVFNAELELVASNRKYREVLGFPDALFDAPRPRFESFIRYNAERGEYGDEDVDTLVERAIARARAPSVPHRFERERADGTPLEVQGAPMPGGGFVTTYTDITERRRAEREIERSGALLRGAIDAVDEAFVLFGPDERLIFCNEKYRDIYAASRDLIVAGASFEEIVRGGAARGQFADAVGRVDAWVAERVARHRAGDATLVQSLGDGRVVRVIERRMPDGHSVGFRIDITDLVRATEAAQQASLAKSQFLANMSHEIRTPMNAILGLLQLLRRTALDGRQDDYAAKCEGAGRSLLGLLNDILDFSKAEAGKMVLDPQPFQPDTLLSELSVILSGTVGSKPVEVLYELDPALPAWVRGDALRLQQILINLTGNAIKFTERGEVVLSVAVAARGDGEVTLAVAVRDTGIGIAPEHQALIFSGFTQAEASTTRRYGGTGLGVAISQRLVRAMGGELQLDSASGQGSRFHFTLTLPVVPDPAPPARLPLSDAGPGRRVLFVDDHPVAPGLLATMATGLGWQPTVCDSVAQAQRRIDGAAAAGAPFDAVFIDGRLPERDGWQACEPLQVRGTCVPAARAPLIVLVTAQGRERLAQRAGPEQRLLDGALVKPVTPSMLAEALATARHGDVPRAARSAGAANAPRRLDGLRVLVAEDNPINQQVARELLEDEGALVQVAPHGEAAVSAVATAIPPFDLVLMDLQMPVMDGFVATSRIRQTLGRKDLPIVAMTANTMAGDRDACLAA
ncbi:MAG: PAS-domain containing protein, partial [Rubrivivax sp.]